MLVLAVKNKGAKIVDEFFVLEDQNPLSIHLRRKPEVSIKMILTIPIPGPSVFTEGDVVKMKVRLLKEGNFVSNEKVVLTQFDSLSTNVTFGESRRSR